MTGSSFSYSLDFAELGAASVLMICCFYLFFFLFIAYCYYRIGIKAGYASSQVILAIILCLIPFVNIIAGIFYSLYFVFAEWPVEKLAKQNAKTVKSE